MPDVVRKVARNNANSTLDLASVFYQVELPPSGRPYTTFEADNALWQRKRILLWIKGVDMKIIKGRLKDC